MYATLDILDIRLWTHTDVHKRAYVCTARSHNDRHGWTRAYILSQTSDTPTVTLHHKTGTGSRTPTPADRPAETATPGIWTARRTPAGCTRPPAHTQMSLHTQTQAGIAHTWRNTPVHTQTHREPARSRRTLFPGPCCHTVEMQHPPRAPSRPAPPGPAGHVDEETKMWLGRARWAARKGRGRRCNNNTAGFVHFGGN